MSKKNLNTAIFQQINQLYGQNKQSFNLPELHAILAEQGLAVPERTLRRWLQQWVDNKQLNKTGQKRGTRYELIKPPHSQQPQPAFLKQIEPSKRPAVLAQLRDQWTHHSTALEGNTLSLGDTHSVLELGLTISGKPLREHHQVVGHAKAIDLIYAISTETLTKENLFDLHKAVQTEVVTDIYQPIGAWKVENNFTNAITSEGKHAIIEYADHKDVDALMAELIQIINNWDINNITPENAHETYAKIHLAFVHIHPFADGNGRLARLIANIPLLKAGLPPLLIDQSKRREYITLLADYQTQTPAPAPSLIKQDSFWHTEKWSQPFIQFCQQTYNEKSFKAT